MTTFTPEADAEATDKLSHELLEALDKMFGLHAGFRPVHAKGIMFSGTFTPSLEAATLSRAPHLNNPSTKVIVRFSNFGGIPTIADNDPNANPRGFGIRFYLGEHVHTDIIGHSHNGFPVRTGDEFLELAKAIVTSGPDVPKPTALDTFMMSHPKAMHFFQNPGSVPSSFARENFFAVSAFRFSNKENQSQFGRFQILPEDGIDYLETDVAAVKNANFLFEEIEERLAQGPIKLRIIVEIAEDSDNVSDATVTWPAERRHVNLGTVILTERVSDEDQEARKIILDPIPRVDGIEPTDDPLFNIRAALYLLSGRRRRTAMK